MMHLFNLILASLQVAMRAVLIHAFWGWFILSQFPGLPQIGYVGALGLSMFTGTLYPYRGLTRKEWDEAASVDKGERVALSLLNSAVYVAAALVSLGIGWAVHQFM